MADPDPAQGLFDGLLAVAAVGGDRPRLAAGPGDDPADGRGELRAVEAGQPVILDYRLEQGNPADGPQLSPAVARVIARAGRTPRTVTADRGYGEKPVEDDRFDPASDGTSDMALRATRAWSPGA